MINLNQSIELYKSVGPRNADFLFPWLYKIYNKTYLTSILPDYVNQLALDKTKLTIFDVLVDDLADNSKIRNKRLLKEAIKIPMGNSNKYNEAYLNVTKTIWDDCIRSIKQYPRYDEFKDIFFFDLDQVMNSMRYSFLINTSNFSNYQEDKMYLNHGVMVILHCDMDLMCSPSFKYEELGKLRPILHYVQDIAHIGNMLNTYHKEIHEADFSSPIISMAIREGLIDKNKVIQDPDYAYKRLEPLVLRFQERMENNLNKIKFLSNNINSININDFYERLKEVWNDFLNREKYWANTQNLHKKNKTLTINNRKTITTHWVRI